MIARQLGHSVILLEKFKHPRFAVGESSTPLANLLLEELAQRYDLPEIASLSKWGSWQQAHPEIGCGLKRGFTFYHHTFGRPFTSNSSHSNQLLVAASPHDGIADTHWYRPDFDHFFLREAQRLGAAYLDEVHLHAPVWNDTGATLEGERTGETFFVHTRFVVDATGPRGFLHRALQLPELPLEHLPHTQALYSHFTGVRRLDEMGLDAVDGENAALPYPVDDAALHHVFDGGWIWVLRFKNGITSAGVAATEAVAEELGFVEGAPAWERLLERLPTVREQFAEAHAELDFVYAPRLSFCSGMAAGEQWALLPSAAGFIDPLLSTGFPLTLLGISRLAKIIEHAWGTPQFQEQLQTYAMQTRDELLATERMAAALYANMDDFPLFTALSLLYFAAASFTETARRLGRPQLAGSFLMHDHPLFGPQSQACLEQALLRPRGQARQALMKKIQSTIEPFDVAGLSKGLNSTSLHNWYPVRAEDLFESAPKVEASHAEIEQLLQRCGFTYA